MKIRMKSLVAALIALGVATPAQASLLFTIKQNGSDVDAIGSGTVNKSTLEWHAAVSNEPAQVKGKEAILLVGSTTPQEIDVFSNVTGTGPSAFGSGDLFRADSGSGNAFAVLGYGGPYVGVPKGYTSGTQLNGTATWTGQTLSTLGLRPGTYTWTWGSGATADFATLIIGDAPEPATLALFVAGLAALARARRQDRGTA